MTIKVVKATQEYIDLMKDHLRGSDEETCWDVARYTANEGLQYSFDRSDLSWIALVDGDPILCWGVGKRALLSHVGVPWLLATDKIGGIGFRVVRHSKEYVKQMLDKYSLLETWVDARNKLSMVWLKWCNFNMDKAEPLGIDHRLFHRFWMEREEV